MNAALHPSEIAERERQFDEATGFSVAEWNRGARVADGQTCQVCGARGFVNTCPTCEAAK